MKGTSNEYLILLFYTYTKKETVSSWIDLHSKLYTVLADLGDPDHEFGLKPRCGAHKANQLRTFEFGDFHCIYHISFERGLIKSTIVIILYTMMTMIILKKLTEDQQIKFWVEVLLLAELFVADACHLVHERQKLSIHIRPFRYCYIGLNFDLCQLASRPATMNWVHSSKWFQLIWKIFDLWIYLCLFVSEDLEWMFK